MAIWVYDRLYVYFTARHLKVLKLLSFIVITIWDLIDLRFWTQWLLICWCEISFDIEQNDLNLFDNLQQHSDSCFVQIIALYKSSSRPIVVVVVVVVVNWPWDSTCELPITVELILQYTLSVTVLQRSIICRRLGLLWRVQSNWARSVVGRCAAGLSLSLS